MNLDSFLLTKRLPKNLLGENIALSERTSVYARERAVSQREMVSARTSNRIDMVQFDTRCSSSFFIY